MKGRRMRDSSYLSATSSTISDALLTRGTDMRHTSSEGL